MPTEGLSTRFVREMRLYHGAFVLQAWMQEPFMIVGERQLFRWQRYLY